MEYSREAFMKSWERDAKNRERLAQNAFKTMPTEAELRARKIQLGMDPDRSFRDQIREREAQAGRAGASSHDTLPTTRKPPEDGDTFQM